MLYLKEHRLMKGLTQAQLAKKSGLAQATISHIESGLANPTFTTLSKIASCLNLTTKDLFIKPCENLKLNRFEIDEIARHIVNGELPTDPKKATLVKDLALLQTQKLAAANKPGKLLAKASRWNTKSRYLNMKKKYSEEIVMQLLKRVEKLLAS